MVLQCLLGVGMLFLIFMLNRICCQEKLLNQIYRYADFCKLFQICKELIIQSKE